jgi:hypothetical protein
MRRTPICLAVLFLAACSYDNDPRVSGPSFDISEARTGGNPDIFFATPLASNPSPGSTNFDAGASHAGLVPYLRVCETDGAATAAGCLVDVTADVTGSATGLEMGYGGGSEMYSVNWHTSGLITSKRYRIEIWGVAITGDAEKEQLDPRWLFGWRDIQHSPNVSNCSGLEAFCQVKFGQTVPVKVRIEQFVFCPVSRNCAMQFVKNGVAANLEAKLDNSTGAPNAQLFIPGQNGANFAVAFEPCSASENLDVSHAIDLPTFGPCLKAMTTFTTKLEEPATVSLCDDLDPDSFGLDHEQLDQLSLHHFTEEFAKVKVLPEDWRCADPTSGAVAQVAPGGLRGMIYAAGGAVRGLFAPRTLTAAPRIHRGGGGHIEYLVDGDAEEGGGGEEEQEESSTAAFAILASTGTSGVSYFKLALPGKFQYEIAGDGLQSGIAGANHLLRVKVTDFFGEPVENARVHWASIAPPSDGATVLGVTPAGETYTDASGIAQQTVTLANTGGRNVFRAFGRGIADSRATGCIVPPDIPARCNGPRSTFDPFLPFNVPDFDPSGVENVVVISEGTRQLFTVFGCAPGEGTATVDGNFTDAEWGCALTFPFTANVSGGSTPATLYVMNDGSNLYLAVRLARASGDKVNTLQFNFDNNNSWSINGTGAAQAGDDVLSLGGSGFTDAFLTAKCANSSQSSCWSPDVSAGGTNNGAGALANNGTFTTYELSHPLNTTDNASDFSLVAGQKVGLFLTMQTGAGAAGNTQWPGFRKYLEITIKP